MSDHPSTYEGTPTGDHGFNWDDRASIHRVGDGEGVFDKAKGLRNGSFAEMVQHLMLMPEDDRNDYVIQKAGDRKYTAAEASELSKHPDYPFRG